MCHSQFLIVVGLLLVVLSHTVPNVPASLNGNVNATRSDLSYSIETLINDVENNFLSIRNFYGNELGKFNLIYQLAGNQCSKKSREAELFSRIPQSMFLRTCSDFEFITENQSVDSTVDELFYMEKNAAAVPWPTLVIFEDSAGVIIY